MAAAAAESAAATTDDQEEIDLLLVGTQPASSLSLLTPYGWGTLRRRRPPPPEGDGMLDVRLEWGARCYLRPEDVLDRAIVPLGACVLTTSGAGVVVGFRRTPPPSPPPSSVPPPPQRRHVYVVRLWNRIGCDGSALAYLHGHALVRQLKAAPGLEVETPQGKGVLIRYDASERRYWVRIYPSPSPTSSDGDGGDSSAPAPPTHLLPFPPKDVQCPKARTQPIIEGIFQLLSEFWAEHRRRRRTQLFVPPATPSPDRFALAGVGAGAGGSQATLGGLGTAAWTEARRRVEQALVSSYGPSGSSASGEEKWKDGGGVEFWELPRVLGLSWGERAAEGGEGGKAWDLQALWDSTQAGQLFAGPSTTGAAALVGASPWAGLAVVADRDPTIGDVLAELRREWRVLGRLQARFRQTRAVQRLLDGVAALRGRYEALITQSEELHFLGKRGLVLLNNLMSPDAPSSIKAKALFRAAHARVAKHLEGSSGGATTPTADASTPAEEEQPTTKSSSYSITASLGLTLLVDVEAIIRAHLESVVCVAKGLNGLTLQGFTLNGLNYLESSLLGLLSLLDASITSSGNGEGVFALLAPSPPSREQGPGSGSGMATAVLLAEHLGAPTALRDITRSLHTGKIGFGDATRQVLMCLDGDDEVLAAVDAMVGHGEALLGRLEALRVNPAFRALLRSLHRTPPTQPPDHHQQQQQQQLSAEERSVEEVLFAHLEDMDPEALVAQVETAFLRDHTSLSSSDAANTAATDRSALMGRLADRTLGFLLHYLPALPIPPLEGATEDNAVAYKIEGLDLGGVQLRREDVEVRIGGPAVAPSAAAAPATTASATSTYDPPAAPSAPAAPSLPSPPLPSSTSLLLVEQEEVGTAAGEELLVVEARNIRAKLNRLRWSYRQLVFPFMKGEGTANATITDAAIHLGFMLKRKQPTPGASSSEQGQGQQQQQQGQEQPVVVLTRLKVTIDRPLELRIADSAFAWAYNLLVALFAGAIREYIAQALRDVLADNVADLLRALNDLARSSWPLLSKATGLQLHALPPYTDQDERAIREAAAAAFARQLPEQQLTWAAPIQPQAEGSDIAVTVAGSGSLGLHVNIVPDPLAPEDEGLLLFPQEGARPLSPFGRIVVQSVDPTAAVAQGLRAAARAEQERGRRFPVRHLAQLTGAMWTGINGKSLARVTLSQIPPYVRRLQRPFTLHLRLDPTALRMGQGPATPTPTTTTTAAAAAVGGVAVDADEGAAKRAAAGEAAAAAAAAYKPAVYVFREPTAGICFAPSPILVPQSHDGTERLSPPLVVSGFAGADCAAARSGVVKLGQVLLAVNGVKVVGMGFEATLAVLRDPRRPMRLDLGVNPDAELVVEREEGEGKACCLDVEVALFSLSSSAQQGQGEGGRVLGPAAGEELPLVVVTGLVANRPGPLEASGRCQPGDILIAINDLTLPTPEGGGLKGDVARLRDLELSFPCRLAFLRPSTGAVCEVVVPAPPADGQWGAVFGRGGEQGGDRPVLRGFRRLPGPLARRGLGQTACRPGRVLLTMNGNPLTEVLRRIQAEVPREGAVAWVEVEARLRAIIQTTPLPASLTLRDMEAFAALRGWCVG